MDSATPPAIQVGAVIMSPAKGFGSDDEDERGEEPHESPDEEDDDASAALQLRFYTCGNCLLRSLSSAWVAASEKVRCTPRLQGRSSARSRLCPPAPAEGRRHGVLNLVSNSSSPSSLDLSKYKL